tara:strand:- start:1657 stop:1929 length:273 start_codon:yes stop_codon:yes gene_type:complete
VLKTCPPTLWKRFPSSFEQAIKPPKIFFDSYMQVEIPFCVNNFAQLRPDMPLPTTATLLLIDFRFVIALTRAGISSIDYVTYLFCLALFA